MEYRLDFGYRIRFEAVKEHMDFYDSLLSPLSQALTCFELSENSSTWVMDAYVHDHDQVQKFTTALALGASSLDCDIPQWTLSDLKDYDWVRENLLSFQPLSLGRFFIHGSHFNSSPSYGYIPIEVDAGLAFGSGEHESTQGCLMAIQWLHQNHGPMNLALDMGCGSGILGMAIAKLYHMPVHMVDEQKTSVKVAQINLENNHLKHRVKVYQSKGFSKRYIFDPFVYDLIVSNIFVRPLCAMAQDMKRYTHNSSVIILSGILNHQAHHVIWAYGCLQFKLIKRINLQAWSTLILSR